MSEDLFAQRPRMKDYLKPEDLNTEACVDLAATVLSEQAEALTHAAREAAVRPNKENLSRLETLRNFYRSDWFKVLSLGLADGEQAMKQIIKDALRGRKLLYEAVRIRDQDRR